ncbi:Uncharacterised protein [Klebsiella pneumoniae]|nr:Uncharacterised protein [Klebsiella pneumoniae]
MVRQKCSGIRRSYLVKSLKHMQQVLSHYNAKTARLNVYNKVIDVLTLNVNNRLLLIMPEWLAIRRALGLLQVVLWGWALVY